MGNSCLRLRAGSASLTPGKKSGSGAPIQNDGLPSGERRYRGATSRAKYEVPPTRADGVDATEPELDLTARTAALDEQEVETFFADAGYDVGEGGRGKMAGAGVGALNTHVEVFSLATNSATNDARKPDADRLPADKTHVSVFRLQAGDDRQPLPSSGGETGVKTDTVHIRLSPLSGHKHPERHLVEQSGTDNPAFVLTDADPPVPPLGDSAPTTGGAINLAFASDSQTCNRSDASDLGPRHLAAELDIGDGVDLDENSFFFGMESVKFQSPSACHTERDREIAEIVSEIETIEERMCSRLWRHTAEASHSPIGSGLRDDVTRNSNLYEDVLNNLKDVCVRVEDVLRKKGSIVSDGISDDWLNLPDLSALTQKYETETRVVQTTTVKRLLEAAKTSNESKVKEVLEEYKRAQERLMRLRDVERRSLLDKLRKKMADVNRRTPSPSSRDEDDERRQLQSQYNELMDKEGGSDEDEEVVVGDDSSSSHRGSFNSENGSVLSYLDEESSAELDLESTNVLKETLTRDIQSRMTEMTSSDFRSIMDIYREERSSLRSKQGPGRSGLKQSLWEKLAERRKHVDESIHEGLPKISEAVVSEPAHKDDAVQCSNTETADQSCSANPSLAEASTEVDDDLLSLLRIDQSLTVTEQDLSKMRQDILADTRKITREEGIVKQDLERVLNAHFTKLKEIRETRERNDQIHRQRVLEKLKQRRDAQKAVSVEDFEKAIEAEEQDFAEKEKLLERRCLESFGQRRIVTQDDVDTLLRQYESSQEELNRRRIRQRSELGRRLQEKLAAKKSEREGDKERVDRREPEGEKEREPRPRQIEQTIRAMDEEFYESLLIRKQKGEISETELSRLIEEHLNKVDEFRKNVRKVLSRRRGERREELSKQEMSALVEENKAKQQQVERLRKDERDKVENKLRERLNKMKKEKANR